MGYATKEESRFENDPSNFARESFDYTKWQENLFEHMTIEEISKNAAEYREKMEN